MYSPSARYPLRNIRISGDREGRRGGRIQWSLMVAAASVSMTWGELCLTTVVHMSSSFFTHFVTVGIFVGMHFPACATQISLLPGPESAPSCYFLLCLWQSPSVDLTVFEMGSSAPKVLTQPDPSPTHEWPHTCPEFSRSFNDTSNLSSHLRIHHGRRLISGGKSFGQSMDLISHCRNHMGEKPCVCPSFAQRPHSKQDILQM